MTDLSQLSFRVPIGSDAEGRPVMASRAFFDFCAQLFARVGGASAPSLVEIIQSSPVVLFAEPGEDAMMIPGPAGANGVDGQPGASALLAEPEPGADAVLLGIPSKYRPITDISASRALNTTYTNTSSDVLMVMATVRSAITLAGGNAYVQAKSDTATPPTVAASGIVGIQAGLLNEDNTFQVVFTVAPMATYILSSSTTNGTTTLSKWFEMPI